jgi:hypothetical protein
MDGWLGLVGWDAGGMDVSYVCTGDTMSSVAAGGGWMWTVVVEGAESSASVFPTRVTS